MRTISHAEAEMTALPPDDVVLPWEQRENSEGIALEVAGPLEDNLAGDIETTEPKLSRRG